MHFWNLPPSENPGRAAATITRGGQEVIILISLGSVFVNWMHFIYSKTSDTEKLKEKLISKVNASKLIFAILPISNIFTWFSLKLMTGITNNCWIFSIIHWYILFYISCGFIKEEIMYSSITIYLTQCRFNNFFSFPPIIKKKNLFSITISRYHLR